jgi:uncharacterized protein YwbE
MMFSSHAKAHIVFVVVRALLTSLIHSIRRLLCNGFLVDLLLEQIKKTGCITTTVVFEISYTSTLLPLLSRRIDPEFTMHTLSLWCLEVCKACL